MNIHQNGPDDARVIIGSSNLNLAPADAALFHADKYLDFLEDGGYDRGFEWTAIRLPRARKAGRLLGQAGLVAVLHESWREQTVRGSLRSMGRLGLRHTVDELEPAAVFPLLDQCYDGLDELQQAGRLPLIVHPGGQYLDFQPQRRPRQTYDPDSFAEIWYQPTAEWARSADIPLDADVAEVARSIHHVEQRQSLDGTVIDLHHMLSTRNGARFSKPVELIQELVQAPSCREVQVSLRPDFGGYSDELRLACDGRIEQTRTGDILQAIHEAVPAGQTIPITVEVAASEIRSLDIHDYAAAHANITGSIRQLFGRLCA